MESVKVNNSNIIVDKIGKSVIDDRLTICPTVKNNAQKHKNQIRFRLRYRFSKGKH